jgi:hypothetical protein
MTNTRRDGLCLLVLGCALFVLLGSLFERVSGISGVDFRVVYYSARCLLHHGDPYNPGDLLRTYRAEGGEARSDPAGIRKVVTSYFYLPTAFAFTVPFSLMPFHPAHLLWMTLTAASLILAGSLIWSSGPSYSQVISGCLVAFLLVNSLWLFMIGNSAGIAIALCSIAVWCFLREQFAFAGVLCLAISLIVKPHDTGLVWLYLLLAGGAGRKRALQTLAVALVLSLPSVLWVTHVAPNWIEEMHANMQVFSAPGDLDDIGPASKVGEDIDAVVELQSDFSIFIANPLVYNLATYILCAALLIVWAMATLRSRASPMRAWLALAAIAPLSMLPLYHREHDAKILLLAVPACAILWAEGGARRWFALLLTTAGIGMNGDFLSLARIFLVRHFPAAQSGLSGRLLTIVLARPIPLILLAMSIFYLWVYVRHGSGLAVSVETQGSGGATSKPLPV